MNGGDDWSVSAAAAQVALKGLADLCVSRSRDAREKRDDGKNHSRRTIAALESAFIEERLLHGMQRVAARESFDRRDWALAERGNGDLAAAPGDAINQDCARATLTFAAPVFGAGEMKLITQCRQERTVGRSFDRKRLRSAVDGKVHRQGRGGRVRRNTQKEGRQMGG